MYLYWINWNFKQCPKQKPPYKVVEGFQTLLKSQERGILIFNNQLRWNAWHTASICQKYQQKKRTAMFRMHYWNHQNDIVGVNGEWSVADVGGGIVKNKIFWHVDQVWVQPLFHQQYYACVTRIPMLLPNVTKFISTKYVEFVDWIIAFSVLYFVLTSFLLIYIFFLIQWIVARMNETQKRRNNKNTT